MKRWLFAGLALLCLMGLAACAGDAPAAPVPTVSIAVQPKPAVPAITVKVPDGEATLSESDSRILQTILDEGAWLQDLGKCESDCVIETERGSLQYHSECGTFNDYANGRCLILNEEQQRQVNELLSAYATLGQVF